jgi:hypothetical protein
MKENFHCAVYLKKKLALICRAGKYHASKTRYEHTIGKGFKWSNQSLECMSYRKSFISETGVMRDLYFSRNMRFRVHV